MDYLITIKEALKDYWESNFDGLNLAGKIVFSPILVPWGCWVSILIIFYYGFLKYLEKET